MLLGAIANFVTGIGEVPYEIVSDFVTAGRAIGHTRSRSNPSSRFSWRNTRKSQDSDLDSEEEQQQQYHEPAEYRGPAQCRGLGRPNHGDNDGVSLDTNDNEEDNVRHNKMNQDLPASAAGQRQGVPINQEELLCYLESRREHGVIYEIRTHGSRMSKKFLKNILWLPTDLTLSLSKGFHNAPMLYHDQMVKELPKVVGFRSGLTAAVTVCHLSSVIKEEVRTDLYIGTPRWILLRYNRLGHPASVWRQEARSERNG